MFFETENFVIHFLLLDIIWFVIDAQYSQAEINYTKLEWRNPKPTLIMFPTCSFS